MEEFEFETEFLFHHINSLRHSPHQSLDKKPYSQWQMKQIIMLFILCANTKILTQIFGFSQFRSKLCLNCISIFWNGKWKMENENTQFICSGMLTTNRQKWVVHDNNSHGDSDFHCIIASWAIQFRLPHFKRMKRKKWKPTFDSREINRIWLINVYRCTLYIHYHKAMHTLHIDFYIIFFFFFCMFYI